MWVLRQSSTYAHMHLYVIHTCIYHTENKEQFHFKAVSRQFTCWILLVIHKHIYRKTHVYIRLRRRGATIEVLPGMGCTSSKYKSIPPKEFTVHYIDENLYHVTNNGPSRTRCKWAMRKDCHLNSAPVLKSSCHHTLTKLHNSLSLAQKVLLPIHSGSFWQFCVLVVHCPVLTVI